MTTCKQVTIFEGPDGGGKSYAAKVYAEATGARYIHLGPFPAVKSAQLARLYVEAMLPALLGYQDVVLDRCWLSEEPYAIAYREGRKRLDRAHERMLARLALRCGAVVVLCLPGFETCATNWASRRGEELLQSERQLRLVYEWYESSVEGVSDRLDLSAWVFNYTCDDAHGLPSALGTFRPHTHPLDALTAGNWVARAAIIGEAFGSVKETDLLYQWPFASFSGQGCSRWFTEQLHAHGVEEHQLLWLNADQLPGRPALLTHLQGRHLVAFGRAAAEQLRRYGLTAATLPHPQNWKCTHHHEPYAELQQLKELLTYPKESIHA